MGEWTKEPWRLGTYDGSDKRIPIKAKANHGNTIGWLDYDDVDHDEQDANAERLIACVNALTGVPDPAAVAGLVGALRYYADENNYDIEDAPYVYVGEDEIMDGGQIAREALKKWEGK